MTRPTNSFNAAAKGQAQDSNLQDPLDLNPPRDKDNAHPKRKPKFAKKAAPNMAPSGMKGTPSPASGSAKTAPKPDSLKSIVKTHPKPELLTGGRFIGHDGYGFAVELSPYRTAAGLDGGKINQLEIQHDDKIVAQYKHSYRAREPKLKEHKNLVQKLQRQFGDIERESKPIGGNDQSKDHGHER